VSTRRQFLRAGTVTLAVGGAALAYRAADQGVFAVSRGTAYALWRTWERTGGIEPVVAAGILAANAHDSQPWRFRVEVTAGPPDEPREAVVEIFRDPDRLLGAFDPFQREVHASIGCAVENIVVTAGARGYRATVDLLPGGAGPDLLARVGLARGPAEPTDLAGAVPRRHTNRFPYQPEAVPAALIAGLDDRLADLGGISVRWLTDDGDLQTFREETVLATEAFIADEDLSRDSHAWFRHSWAELQDEASGLTLDGSVASRPFAAAAKLLPETSLSQANSGFLATTRRGVTSSPLAAVIVADESPAADPTGAREAWLRTGRAWQRLHLALTAEDLVAQPLSQLTELADRERVLGVAPRFGEVLDDLAGPGVLPMMCFRVGYPTRDATPTPRRPLVEVVDYA
jgi:nitroreductase